MADSVASTQSRPSRAASKKRRHATVPTETENKLARAARSAQRLAQLSDAARDDSTLDLFPDDPTRATLEAMNIDVRQGTLHGFELPDVVLAAVGVIDAGDGAPLDARTARRAPRAAKADEPTPVNAMLSGLDIEPWDAAGSSAAELAFGDATPKERTATEEKLATSVSMSTRDATTSLTPAMAAATVARSVTALRQASATGATGAMDATSTNDSAAASTSGGVKAPPRFAATFAKATASRDVDAHATAGAARVVDTGTNADAADGVTTGAVAVAHTSTTANAAVDTSAGTSAGAAVAANAETNAGVTADENAAFAESWREARRAEAAAAALRAAPELDRARATAFADTVDALYGVIADQRRAASDHSRRMKWLLPIVVGALLVTVAIGITQTLLLMRLTRETTAQQHRIEELMQNQQAAMTSLLDTHMAMADAAAANAATTAAAAAATPQQGAATPARTKRAARAQHAHKLKASNSH